MTAKFTKNIVLLSGGIDSAVCVHLLRQKGLQVSGLFVDYGQAARVQESKSSSAIARFFGLDLQVVTVSARRDFSDGEIIGRNAFLALTALVSNDISSGNLVLGIHKGTQYYDCSPAFANSLDLLLSEHSDGTVRLITPLLHWNKKDIFAYSKRENIPLDQTYSCERGTQPPCGQCASCLDRLGINASTETLS